MASSSGGGGAAGPSWERYEELAKAAIVADPHGGTRFFLKTRIQRGRGIQIVSRVANSRNSSSATHRTVVTSHLGRLTRLLRFVMQEVLGPMKPVLAADTNAAVAAAATAAAAAPRAGASNAAATPQVASKSKKKKTSGKKK